MGQKTHPVGFRVGVLRKWRSNWYVPDNKVPEYVKEDHRIREHIRKNYRGAGIAEVLIERAVPERVRVIVRAARPGIVIGRGGSEIERLQEELSRMIGREVRIGVMEVERPELEAPLVAQDVAFQIENRINPYRAMKETIRRVMAAGAQGVKIRISGRLGGADIARSVEMKQGRVPLQTLRADVDYGLAEAMTKYGVIGVKAWVFRGEVWSPKESREVS
ncbi:MAG: 30S ribosomal protein S3 [Acetothermia bacterium 64_32]|nr:MAG: 30S ribosomal protein S3 [Acetothermia bacterium 64_32]MBC7097764.1 30S ribosomal protein S3 [Candidatus Bipolaricaulota bacterium]HAF70237.1 30S ribosomal protein S3 [Candidatus Acetothermia bacterium]